MKNFTTLALKTNEKGDKVEQKFSRVIRNTVMNELVEQFPNRVDNYVQLTFKDGRTVWLEVKVTVKGLEFQPE